MDKEKKIKKLKHLIEKDEYIIKRRTEILALRKAKLMSLELGIEIVNNGFIIKR